MVVDFSVDEWRAAGALAECIDDIAEGSIVITPSRDEHDAHSQLKPIFLQNVSQSAPPVFVVYVPIAPVVTCVPLTFPLAPVSNAPVVPRWLRCPLVLPHHRSVAPLSVLGFFVVTAYALAKDSALLKRKRTFPSSPVPTPPKPED
jgi:hypothetical protein